MQWDAMGCNRMQWDAMDQWAEESESSSAWAFCEVCEAVAILCDSRSEEKRKTYNAKDHKDTLW